MIDLTMDDEEKADGDAHTASDNKHTKLSSNATSSQHGMVMKIEAEDAADGSKRRRIMHSNALGAIMHIHVEDVADGSTTSYTREHVHAIFTFAKQRAHSKCW